jgi:putative SOS response-associated peptidase YedK
MCGRFVSARKRLELLEEFAVERDRVADDRSPDYNVAPTKRIYAVLDRAEKPAGPEKADPKQADARSDAERAAHSKNAGDADGERPRRELRLVRWGLVPSWAKDAAVGARMINARAETVAVKPAFRGAFARRRCIIPADGYYEWQAATAKGDNGDKGNKKAKQPFYIYRSDGGILCFAGIYELWRDGSVPADHEDAWLWTASIITTEATDEIGAIHDRTPMVIPPKSWDDWLDPANNEKELLLATMLPATSSGAGGLASHPVSTAVNSVRNNGPDLIEPLPAGSSGQSADGDAGARGSSSGQVDRSSLF